MPTEGIRIRPGQLEQSSALAALTRRVRLQNLATIPHPVHTREEDHRWMRDVVFGAHDVWVADCDGRPVAIMVLGQPDWLEHLYVDARHTGRGIGARLVDLAKRELPAQIQLWTFQSNVGARRFYERHGFEAVEWTDGDNEEKAPDVRYLYRP